ncbi:probable exported protein STY0357 [hydrothermal vent metagenome]|uniref:Probable exported protein STY0357 n=1 Tax=hydrothermal vent metagenome TaxID=652676 RepID=A0A1W1EDE2_9ZZZZ
MNMTRAWLIIADFLVVALLFISIILFYLYPTHTLKVSIDQNRTISLPYLDKNVSLENIELDENRNETMSLEEFMRMANEELSKKEYIEILHNKYLDDSLNKRFSDTNTSMGNSIFIRIFKKEALLEVWIEKDDKYIHLKDYKICSYSGYLGPKLKEGDRQSPEGFYKVGRSSLNPNSKFHLSFNLGYPNAYDRAHNRTGSFLMVHGNCVSIGCYAMTDSKIEDIYALVEAALNHKQKIVQVHIFPFRMSSENIAAYENSRWYDFWLNLKEGYDYFESEHTPPNITVKNKLYDISES